MVRAGVVALMCTLALSACGDSAAPGQIAPDGEPPSSDPSPADGDDAPTDEDSAAPADAASDSDAPTDADQDSDAPADADQDSDAPDADPPSETDDVPDGGDAPVFDTSLPAWDYPAAQRSAAAFARHKEMRTRGPLAATWDGRVWFTVQYDVALANYHYAVSVFRAEALPLDAAGLPNIAAPETLSAVVRIENPDASPGRLHLTVFPHPSRAENPFPSDALGNADANGAHHTYDFVLIGKSEDEGATFPADIPFLTMTRGRVTVGSPRTATASIVRAAMDVVSEPLRTTAGDYLYGYEPSVSLDGRLVFWNARPFAPASDRGGGVCMYSFNPSPANAAGWSPARSLSDLYWAHGPGAAAETMVAGVPFSERYPLALRPIRDPSGRVMEEGEWIPGPYPWLSFDATEIFFQGAITFFGPFRGASTVVGARTNWVLRHLDGAINPTRGNLSSDGRPDHWPSTAEGAFLDACYDLQTLEDGTRIGAIGYQRILMSGLGLSGSMWSPFRDAAAPALPLVATPNTYMLLMSHSGRYVEIPLPEVVDGHYLLVLPMNEATVYDHAKIRLATEGTGATPGASYSGFDNWGTRAQMVSYSATVTPDTSGHVQNGTLEAGATFPWEHDDAMATWLAYWEQKQADPGLPASASAVAGDRVRGVVGNAVYFRGGSYVESTLTDDNVARLRAAEQLTVQLWVKRSTSGLTHHLASMGSAFTLTATGDGGVEALLTTDVGEVALVGDADLLQVGAWHHVALVRDELSARLFVDAVQVDGASMGGVSDSAEATLRVGPDDLPVDPADVCLIDELSLSDVARTIDELLVSALVRRGPPESPANPVLPAGLGSALKFVPEGVEQSQALADLGKRLFFDPILSDSGAMSCATCHVPELAFTDGRAQALGNVGQPLRRNTPAIINRALGALHFLDGRATSLEGQVVGPILNEEELASTLERVLSRIASRPELRAAFVEVFGDAEPVTAAHLAEAIAAYERTLLSAGSRFDRGLLTPQERTGRGLFFGKARCAMCHFGPSFSDEVFHDIGLAPGVAVDTGRHEVTGRARDAGKFRTPALRDVARTAPYFHDGRAETLAEVVAFYDRGGDPGEDRDLAVVPLGLNGAERAALEAFLRTLSGTTLDVTRTGPAGVAPSPAPELVAAGRGCASPPWCLWLIGDQLGDDGVVELAASAGGAALAVHAAEGALTRILTHGSTPANYSGAWDSVTLRMDDTTNAHFVEDGVWVRFVSGGQASNAVFVAP